MAITSRGLRTGDTPYSGDHDGLGADVLSLHDWLTVVEEHGNDLLEILGELLDRFPLTMRARETGDVTDIETGIGTALDHCGIGVHGLTCFQSTMVTDWYSRSGASRYREDRLRHGALDGEDRAAYICGASGAVIGAQFEVLGADSEQQRPLASVVRSGDGVEAVGYWQHERAEVELSPLPSAADGARQQIHRWTAQEAGHDASWPRFATATLADTLVVLVSDHGDQLSEHDIAGKMGNLYEASTRVQLVMRLPGGAPSGAEPAQMVDLFPTIFELPWGYRIPRRCSVWRAAKSCAPVVG